MEGSSDYFLGGVTGINIAGPWFRPALVDNTPFNWKVQLYPRPAVDPAISVLYVDQWAMSSTTDHPDESWDLLKFLSGPEGMLEWTRLYGSRSISPVKEITASDDWLNYGGEEHRVDNELILAQLGSTVAPPTNFGDGSAVENIWDAQFDLVIVGQQDVDTAIDATIDMIASELG
jgi:ABC-type glycerol-3-phosphate transport system substrate-binding protein